MTHTYSAIYVKILAFKINFRTIHEKFNVGNQAWVTKMIKRRICDGKSDIINDCTSMQLIDNGNLLSNENSFNQFQDLTQAVRYISVQYALLYMCALIGKSSLVSIGLFF